MPLNDGNYQDALDYFYKSSSESEYFSAEEGDMRAQGAIPKIPIGTVRVRRRRAQEKARLQLKIQHQERESLNIHKSNNLPRLPDYIPAFSERTASAASVALPSQTKPAKRWQSSSAIQEEKSSSRGSKSKSKNNLLSASTESQPGWSVDESDMNMIDLDRLSFIRYNEFKASIAAANCSPTDSRHFDGKRWDLKLTHQKSGYKLYRIKLVGSYRASFIINNVERKVMMMTASPHDN